MDWTPMIGRYRPVEQDALRVLTVVHQLGERPAAATPGSERRWLIDTESQLQHLDHLVRHPIDLTYVVFDQVRSRGSELEAHLGDLARRVRRILGASRRGRHRPSLLRPFDPGSWQRWDDALALLSCRGLLRVEPLLVETSSVETSSVGTPPAGDRSHGRRYHGPQDDGERYDRERYDRERYDGELRYRATAEGARLVESVHEQQPSLAPYRERCELLRTVLPDRLLRPRRSRAILGAYLREISRRLDTFSSDELIRPEDDLLGHLFQSTFSEAL